MLSVKSREKKHLCLSTKPKGFSVCVAVCACALALRVPVPVLLTPILLRAIIHQQFQTTSRIAVTSTPSSTKPDHFCTAWSGWDMLTSPVSVYDMPLVPF